MKKRASIIFIAAFLLLSLMPMAFAQKDTILTPLDDLFTQIIPNKDLSWPNVRDNVSLYIFATFTIIYSIVFAATGLLPLFQNQNGARIGISIAFAIMGVLFPGAIRLISTLGPILITALVISAIIMIMWTGIKGFTQGGGLPAEFQRERMELGRAQGDYKRLRREERIEERDTRNEERALRRLQGVRRPFTLDLTRLENSLRDLRKRINDVIRIRGTAPTDKVNEEIQGILHDLAAATNAQFDIARLEQNINSALVVAHNFDEAGHLAAGGVHTDIHDFLRDQYNSEHGHSPVGGKPIALSGAALREANRLAPMADTLVRRKAALMNRLSGTERTQLNNDITAVNTLLREIRDTLSHGDYNTAEGLVGRCIQVASAEVALFNQIMNETNQVIQEAEALRRDIHRLIHT